MWVFDGKLYKLGCVGLCASCKNLVFACTTLKGVEIEKCQIEKCTRQFVLNAAKNAKSHSNLTQAGQFTAESAGRRKEDQDEDSRLS